MSAMWFPTSNYDIFLFYFTQVWNSLVVIEFLGFEREGNPTKQRTSRLVQHTMRRRAPIGLTGILVLDQMHVTPANKYVEASLVGGGVPKKRLSPHHVPGLLPT